MTKLMTHIVAGYPTLQECERLATAMVQDGVSYLEIQMPFSDPVADGKTIAAANQKALENGMTVEACFSLIKRLSSKIHIPIFLMTYFNIPFHYGLGKFCKKAKENGCKGLIIPDIPIDEEPCEHYISLCKKYELNSIQVISPLTTDSRLKKIAKAANGFVYCMARVGITGERKKLDKSISDYLDRVKSHIPLPLAVGFGISKMEHVKILAEKADIIVIGSKIMNLYTEGGIKKVRAFIGGVVQYLRSL